MKKRSIFRYRINEIIKQTRRSERQLELLTRLVTAGSIGEVAMDGCLGSLLALKRKHLCEIVVDGETCRGVATALGVEVHTEIKRPDLSVKAKSTS